MPDGSPRGARWLRCDLHVHTPFDSDRTFGENVKHAIEAFKKGNVQKLAEIAQRFVDACRKGCNGEGLGLVALTDHNSIEGYRYLKPQFDSLAREAAEKGLAMPTILPGVEFSVGGERPLHFLVIFAGSTSADDIDGTIRHVFGAQEPFDPKTGKPRATGASVTTFLDKLYEYCCPPSGDRHLNFVILPAHADGESGIARETGATELQVATEIWDEMKGHLRQRVITRKDWHGFQTRRLYDKLPQAFKDLLCQWITAKRHQNWDDLTESKKNQVRSSKHWPLVQCSDPHKPEDIGSKFTWLKMELPDVEGIRLALLDPESRLRNMTEGPPGRDYPVIRRIAIKNTDFIDDISIDLNDSLNTLIGGRGSGKSTLIEAVRYTLDRARREDFDEDEAEVKDNIDKLLGSKERRDYGETPGILLPGFEFQATVRVSGREYLVNRDSNGITVRDSSTNDKQSLDIRTLISPRILSQRQIARIARDPVAQRRELDGLTDPTAAREFNEKLSSLRAKLTSLQADRKISRGKVSSLPERQTELRKIADQIALLERGANKDILDRFRRLQSEDEWLNKVVATLTTTADQLTKAGTTLAGTEQSIANPPEDPSTPWLNDVVSRARTIVTSARTAIEGQAKEIRDLSSQVKDERVQQWLPGFEPVRKEYEKLTVEMQEKGVTFGEHEKLLQRRSAMERDIAGLVEENEKLRSIEDQIKETRAELVQLYESRLERRRQLARALEEQDADIRLDLVPFGDRTDFFERRGEWFGGAGLQERDWTEITDYVFSGDGSIPTRLLSFVGAMKSDIQETQASGKALDEKSSAVAKLLATKQLTRNFFNSLVKGDRIRIDEIETFVPEDRVEAKVRGNDGVFKPITQGSIGQRSMAILGLLLTAGTQPLIIDQPEEDLDNQYVFGVVVDLLRKRKFSRQLIIATHNANIPVNGDAELIVALGVANRLGQIICSGSIDRPEVKSEVSVIMEGSKEAFRLRQERYGY
jgi:ABC-type enterochelin transport system ATPase subunit